MRKYASSLIFLSAVIFLQSKQGNTEDAEDTSDAVFKAAEIFAKGLDLKKIRAFFLDENLKKIKTCMKLPDADVKAIYQMDFKGKTKYLIVLRGEKSGISTIIGEKCDNSFVLSSMAIVALSYAVQSARKTLSAHETRRKLMPVAKLSQDDAPEISKNGLEPMLSYKTQAGSVRISTNKKDRRGVTEVRSNQNEIFYKENFEF